jgi:hypothetical protein
MGQGIVPARVPTWQPSNLMEDRVVQFADGDIFNVITNGRRTMPAYKFRSRCGPVGDHRVCARFAAAAHGTINDVPEEQKAELK